MSIDRRGFIKSGLALGGGAMLRPGFALAKQSGPKYLIQIHYDLGLSALGMFDARPRVFTAAGMCHNFLYEAAQNPDQDPLGAFRRKDAIPYGKHLSGPGYYSPIFADFIEQHGKDLAVLNGIHMSDSDGHGRNTQIYLTGTNDRANLALDLASGGESNNVYSALLLSDQRNYNLAERSRYLELGTDNLVPMLDVFTDDSSRFFFNERFTKHISSTYDRYRSDGSGVFSKGVEALWRSGVASDDLIDRLKESKENRNEQGDGQQFEAALRGISDSFAINLTNHAVIQLRLNTDSHGSDEQRRKLETMVTIDRHLKSIMQILKGTDAPDRNGSLFDQTVVTIAGEFDRTTRNNGAARGHNGIFNSGSDHNHYSNSILVFGGGLKGGQVIGATDMDELPQKLDRDPDADDFGRFSREAFDYLQKNRRKTLLGVDDSCNKVIGKPWDFGAEGGYGAIAKAEPATYSRENHLTIQSLQNTILHHFGFREAAFKILGEGNPKKAKLIPRLLG